ncbi:MAG: DUF1735 and LamG domain-containing protein [Bacteroidales bacterium]|nr:DUF1735 and LamG domain-containing protein [Bacteroidales bacterium]MDE6147077.1 DUF1735 and LamG domain-containing protein [Bacteroidales bacterium]
MKKILKWLSVAAAVALAAVSCKDEMIPSKDTYGAYKGVTGDFAYIVGATMPEYDAFSTEIQHTPIGELGKIEKSFVVALTKAQDHDVDVFIGVDNSALTGAYEAFPDGVLRYPEKITVHAGDLADTVRVVVDNADFAKLGEPSYMAAFKIMEASGVQVSTNSNVSLIYVTTRSIDPTSNRINLASATHTYNVTNYTDATSGDAVSVDLTVTGSEEAFSEFEVTLTIDNSLIAEYNEANGTSYSAVPSELVEVVNPVMAKDATSASGSVSIADADRARLTDNNGYLIPVRISDASPATVGDNSGVVYMVINVVNFDRPSNMFSALWLGDWRMATWYKFPQGMDLSGGYTYIFHVFMDEVTDHSRIGNFSDSNEGWINMLRYGERGNKDTRLEWWVGPGNCRKKLYAPAIEAKTWYQYALVYDLESYKMYLDGVLVAETQLSDADKALLQANPPVFQAIEFNSSWVEGYRKGNEFHGRLWNVSAWANAVDESDIMDCVKTAPPQWMYWWNNGAHWAFDDGYGHVVRQTAGNVTMGDIDFSKSTRVETESGGYMDADVSEYIQWIADEYNTFE